MIRQKIDLEEQPKCGFCLRPSISFGLAVACCAGRQPRLKTLGAAAILAGDVGEAPDIAEADRRAGRREDEAGAGIPKLLGLHRLSIDGGAAGVKA